MPPIFFAIVGVILAVLFILVGSVSMAMLWVPLIRTAIIEFILEDSIALFLFGFAFFVLGIILIATTIFYSRRRSYLVHGDTRAFVINTSIIHDHLMAYWSQMFPKGEISSREIVRNNELHLYADLPYLPVDQQKLVVQKAEEQIGQFLFNNIGYSAPFHLTVSFRRQDTD